VEPAKIRFGGGASETVLHPFVALALVAAILLIFVLPRKYVVIPWLLIVFFVPFGQVVVLAGIHLTVYRIAILFGLGRMFMSRFRAKTAPFAGGVNPIDIAFMLCAVFSLISFSAQWMEMPAIVKGLGNLLDTLGGYFVLRFLIRDAEDAQRVVKVLAFVAIVLAVCMTNEHLRHQNVFGLLGGTPVSVPIRDGKARAMGPFEVYITAGVFGATLVPLLVSLCFNTKTKLVGFGGIAGATVMTLCSNSSTPLLAYAAGILALCFWPFRKKMRAFRWGLALVLVTLHLAMKAPVWALIGRIDLTGSSSGFHRYMLVDQCIRHFGDWWLIGTKSYDNWGFDTWDLSNQYVANAVTGGLATLVSFILVISRSFGRLGRARTRVNGDRNRELYIWCLCAALFSHVVAYFGIGYFDQLQVAWYALLAIIAVTASGAIRSNGPKGQQALGSKSMSSTVTCNADLINQC
jgi:hypothetical protein